MSIAALAIRTAAWRALSGRTWAGDRVFNSAIDPLGVSLKENAEPLLVVATEDDAADTTMLDLLGGNRTIDLVVEIALAAAVKKQVDGEEQTLVEVPNTDAGLETSINLIARQIVRALMIDGGEWGALFRRIAPQVQRITSRRGADAENGLRFAARQIVFRCEVLDDPQFGALPNDGPWAAFLARLQADPETLGIAPLVAEAIKGEAIPDWDRATKIIGLTPEQVNAIGLGSPGNGAGVEPETMIEVGLLQPGDGEDDGGA